MKEDFDKQWKRMNTRLYRRLCRALLDESLEPAVKLQVVKMVRRIREGRVVIAGHLTVTFKTDDGGDE